VKILPLLVSPSVSCTTGQRRQRRVSERREEEEGERPAGPFAGPARSAGPRECAKRMSVGMGDCARLGRALLGQAGGEGGVGPSCRVRFSFSKI
jgi:hypothetical protein